MINMGEELFECEKLKPVSGLHRTHLAVDGRMDLKNECDTMR